MCFLTFLTFLARSPSTLSSPDRFSTNPSVLVYFQQRYHQSRTELSWLDLIFCKTVKSRRFLDTVNALNTSDTSDTPRLAPFSMQCSCNRSRLSPRCSLMPCLHSVLAHFYPVMYRKWLYQLEHSDEPH